MGTSKEFNALYKYVASLPVFSDHEHHLEDSVFAEPLTLDAIMNNSYVGQCAGHPSDGTEQARRKLLDDLQYNTYFTWLVKGIEQLHGIDTEISLETWNAVSDKISARHAGDKDLHWRALLEAGYERQILDAYWNPGDDGGHPEIFVPAFRIDKFMYGYHADAIAPNDFPVWKNYRFEGGTLDDFAEMMRSTIRQRYEQGKVVTLKCAEAYVRTINFLPDDKSAAIDAFGTPPDKITEQQLLMFGNYIFNRAAELAGELGIPFQIHMGLGKISVSEPMNFEPMLRKFPNVRFVLFHAGYPWIHQVAGLAHEYDNALPSMTWVPSISTSAAVRALHEFIDAGRSVNSITWGSDCWTAEESVGVLLAWRFVVTKVLSERINDGLLAARDAETLARKLMYQNNRSIYCP